ncbi:glycosyltransferase family 2 protein [Leifsonia sp. SIMBA_070]|uniref:glycosyltransferase family 2 protein n=1 Tax=Leifsonia sp. SIMBA_070 TaxID=3085810 RepID=UPI00397B03C1
MRLAMTLMVRDEADIVGAMIDHHLAQGVDTLIVTDNGSVDGTAELLESYAADGRIVLHHDPEHRKQQAVTVTRMAREAATEHGADWVVNADADEFWLPRADGPTLAEVFSGIPKKIQAFDVPVHDMIGPAALAGTGLQRLVYRDLRDTAGLNRVGLKAHATHDAVHIGDPDVEVVQGNHFVNLENRGPVPAGLEVEVLHFPWRSWEQYSRKVRNAGSAYENSDLTPSPNHHGMRDYRRLLAGVLYPLYLCRHPDAEELEAGVAAGEYRLDTRIAERVPSPVADRPIDGTREPVDRAIGLALADLDRRVAEADDRRSRTEAELHAARDENRALNEQLGMLRRRRVVRLADRAARLLPGKRW